MAMKFMKSIILSVSLAASLTLAPAAFAKEWKTVAIGMEEANEPWNFKDFERQAHWLRCRPRDGALPTRGL